MDNLSEKYYPFSPYNNPVRFVDPDGNGPFDEIVDAGKKIVGALVKKAVERVVEKTVEAGKQIVKDVKDNTTLEISGGAKITEEYGVEVDVKGAGGFGASSQVGEASSTGVLNITTKGIDGEITNSSNKDVTTSISGQIGGNGGEVSYTESEDGTQTTSTAITTETGIPFVQTETSVETSSNGAMSFSTGISSGAKVPIALTSKGSILHFYGFIGINLVYSKDND